MTTRYIVWVGLLAALTVTVLAAQPPRQHWPQKDKALGRAVHGRVVSLHGRETKTPEGDDLIVTDIVLSTPTGTETVEAEGGTANGRTLHVFLDGPEEIPQTNPTDLKPGDEVTAIVSGRKAKRLAKGDVQ